MVSPPPKFPELLFLALITALPKANYSSKAGGLIGKKHQDPFDGYVFTLGYSCLLRYCYEELLNILGLTTLPLYSHLS